MLQIWYSCGSRTPISTNESPRSSLAFTSDAFEDGQGYWQRFAREMRQTMFGANR